MSTTAAAPTPTPMTAYGTRTRTAIAHAHDYHVPELPEAVDIFDTILRDGSQQEGLSLTVDDKLRVAEQLDHLGVHLHRGRLARCEPQGRRSSSRAPSGS